MSDEVKVATTHFPALAAEFRPGAQYFSGLDCVIYLNEDCSYRSARVSPTLSLLMSPTEDSVVGVKIKGVSHLTESLFSILGDSLTEDHRVELRKLFQMAAVSDKFTETAQSEAEMLRRAEMSKRAVLFLEQFGNTTVEVPHKTLKAA